MEQKLTLYGFNNLTKTLSFNIYDVCYAKSEREQKDYIAYIDDIKPQIIHIHEYVLCPLIRTLRKKGYLVIYDLHEDNPGSQKNNRKDARIVYQRPGRTKNQTDRDE